MPAAMARANRQRRTEERSCFVWEWSCPPGGARLSHVYVLGHAAALRSALAQQLEVRNLDPHLLEVLVGATLVVWVVQRGVIRSSIDLRPHVYMISERRETALDDAHAPVVADAILRARNPRLRLRVDWDGISAALPVLEAPALRSGEQIQITRGRGLKWNGYTYFGRRVRECDYGFNDLEDPLGQPLSAFRPDE
jgi:hypothetical protein